MKEKTPTFDELKKRFPHLTDERIKIILSVYEMNAKQSRAMLIETGILEPTGQKLARGYRTATA